MRRAPLAAAAIALATCGAARAATVEVVVEGIEPGLGAVYVALCQGGLSEAECRDGREASARSPTARAIFEDVEPGIYAAAAFQDVNGNRRLDRTGFGLPLEPYGFSGEMGQARPDFARARFAVREPGVVVRARLVRALPPR